MYTTELIQQILTSPAALEIINQLAPVYGEARVALWIFQAIGLELDDMKLWTQEVEAQVVPHTATWSLDDWEDEYAIPRDPSLSIEQRRERIITYRQSRAPMNPYKLGRIATAAANGAECHIKERTGKPSVFTVCVDGIPAKGLDAKIRAAVDRAKQARLSYLVHYETNTEGGFFTAGKLQLGYDITMRQDGNVKKTIGDVRARGAIQMGYDLTIRQP